MSSCNFESILKIRPKTKVLSAAELIKCRNAEFSSVCVGLKRTKPSGTTEEILELDRLRAELKNQISAPRIERLGARSIGEWDDSQGAVKVVRKDGKFSNFGYSVKGGDHYLEFYEAMFLLELNRMEIRYNSMPVSLEQAYLLLLGEPASFKYNQYFTYSTFTRVGFILQKYQDLSFKSTEPTVDDCIWEILLSSILHKKNSAYITNCKHFNDVHNSMQSIKMKIMRQEEAVTHATNDMDITFNRKIQTSGKRKAFRNFSDDILKKECKRSCQVNDRSFLEYLTNGPEYKKFQDIFEKIDVIRLKSQFQYATPCRDLQIYFDVHRHNDAFRKTEPKEPLFRLVILKTNERFPTHSEISKCYHSQESKVPLLVISISESKNIQAFLYHFT